MSYAYQLQRHTGLPSVTSRQTVSIPTGDATFRDCVAAIDLRTLIGDLFRSLHSQPDANTTTLRMELECTWIAWFPRRLEQIVKSLVSNSILTSDQRAGESRVSVYFRRLHPGYELRVTGNTNHLASPTIERTSTASSAQSVCALNAARTLVEQSDGELMIHSQNGQGTMSIAKLPVYCMGDFLEGSL